MELTIGGYGIRIEARDPKCEDGYNDKDTLAFLAQWAGSKASLLDKYDRMTESAKLLKDDLLELRRVVGRNNHPFNIIDIGRLMKNAVVQNIKDWFKGHMNVFNEALEDLDDYNGYLGEARRTPMEEFDRRMRGLSPMEILDRTRIGFETNHKYFYWDGEKYRSTNWHGYYEYLKSETFDAMNIVKERLCIIDHEEIWRLFEDLDECTE